MLETRTYHAVNGLCFRRDRHGAIYVLIKDHKDPSNSSEILLAALTDAAFASVMAAMSARGETSETFNEAVAFLRERPAQSEPNGPSASEMERMRRHQLGFGSFE